MPVIVDKAKCSGCYACVINCPQALFTVIDGKASANNEDCTGCRACVQFCENKAIKFLRVDNPGGGGY